MTFSVEIDKYNPTALTHTLKKLEVIPDFEYDWRIFINAGGIDYGIYLNIDTERQEITLCNQPTYNDGDDYIEDVINAALDDIERGL